MSTPILYAALLCPFSRKIILGLKEKKIAFKICLEKPWDLSSKIKKISMLGNLPVLTVDPIICGEESMIHAYIDDAYPAPGLYGSSRQESMRIRYIVTWFEKIFYPSIYRSIVYERAFKGFYEKTPPNLHKIRSALNHLYKHLITIDALCATDTFLVGNSLSWADIVAASHLSCIEYMIAVPWNSLPFAKRWYMKIKSRPSFQPFLKERIPQIPPSADYGKLDF